MSSFVQVELALFNDHLLAWEPLIEPIIDHRGNVQSPEPQSRDRRQARRRAFASVERRGAL